MNTNEFIKECQCIHENFYIPDKNICIEYDGVQHYRPVSKWGGAEGLQKRQYLDSIKTQYCKDNNIILIRIRYDENPIEILTKNGII